MIELTQEQRQLLEQGQPVDITDQETARPYVLLTREVYERIREVLGRQEDWAREVYPAAMDVFARDGWDDPRMDEYDALDPRRPS